MLKIAETKGLEDLWGIPGRDVLERVALVLNSTLELWKVLRTLAGVTLEQTDADRCSVFLLEGRRLQPATAIGREQNPNLWSDFRAMGEEDLDRIPGVWEKLVKGRAVPVADARNSELIPKRWVEQFCLTSVALVPLLSADEPCGLMAVDYQQPRNFTPADLRLLEAIGAYAGVAIRNARLFEAEQRRSQLREGLAQAAAALVSPLDRAEIARLVVGAYTELVGAKLCAIGLMDAERRRIEAIASHGIRDLEEPLVISDVPEQIVSRLQAQWGTTKELQFDDDPWFADFLGGREAGASRYILLPLRSDRHLLGGILLGFASDTSLGAEERFAATALSAIASAALERNILLEKLESQLKRMEILHNLSLALAGRASAEALTSELNSLLQDRGIDVVGVTFKDRKVIRKLGGLEASSEEKRAARNRGKWSRLPDGSLGVPMWVGRRFVGTLRVRTERPDSEDTAFLEAIASGVAETAIRTALRAEIEEAERERAVASERDRIAADLHDTAGQLFIAINLLARRQAEQVPQDSPWNAQLLRFAQLADEGKWEIDQAIRALAFFPAARRGLASSLRALAKSFEGDSGIQVQVDVDGISSRLPSKLQRALYRVAHEALSNAWRHARCENIVIRLNRDGPELILTISDDGVGPSIQQMSESSRGGMANMRRAMSEVGGTFRIRPVKPHGVKVEARVGSEAH